MHAKRIPRRSRPARDHLCGIRSSADHTVARDRRLGTIGRATRDGGRTFPRRAYRRCAADGHCAFADAQQYAHAIRNIYAEFDTDTIEYADTQSNVYAKPNTNGDTNTNDHTDAKQHPNEYADQHTKTDAYTKSDTYSYQHRHRWTVADSD